MMPTPQEIQKTQGTRLQEKAPWESYASEMNVNMNPELAAQVAEYAKHRYEETKPSSQTQEELCRLKEENTELAEEYQWLKPEEYEDFGARIGRVMSHADFISLLRKSGVSCWYTPHPHPDKVILLYSKNGGPREVACWAQYGQMPELSIMNFDDKGVPLAERRRGWRTCLLQLILKGIITEVKANKFFGMPRQDKAFERYNSTLYYFRQASVGVIE
jgi:hypothetical protein